MSSKKNKKLLITKTKKLDDSFDTDDDIYNISSTAAKQKNQPKKKILETLIDSATSSDEAEYLEQDFDTESDNSSESESSESSSDSSESSESSNDNESENSDNDKNFLKKKQIENIKKKTPKNSNEIFKELIKKQLPDVPSQWKLNINDMKRICKYIDTSIFDKKQCCIWNGYITNMNNSNKGTYVNFYFRNKKVALHRLLYSNFVAPLDSSEYLKFNCDNKGICCNINHYEKYKYSKNNGVTKKEQKHKEPKKEVKEITIVGSDEREKLIIDFD
ncbi:hypothetical protein QJ856_gp0915 [Tupanvirus deep ocean]|uniref:Uncharacterized protein n=2 Tax=Tupanvirus TaxID=2094720 RepID=A0AC62A7Z0_9VIRU|nr:hypothetical protein QJ856_gp0915 [Tupanvirus deep ocean]QKU33842.1 hypothetical protein [Tupanvirus deep ocean]